MEKLRDVTLGYLLKRDRDGNITHFCMTLKKKGFARGVINGFGGKYDSEKDKSIEDALKREGLEELGVGIKDPQKVAELSFYFPHKPEWNQLVHTYFVENWRGEPMESEEVKPEWIAVSDLPYDKMWKDDIIWLPKAIGGKLVIASFVFNPDQTVAKHNMSFIKEF